MHQLNIGTSSEFVGFELEPESFEGWLRANVSIAVRGFTGKVSASLQGDDFRRFEEQLRPLYETLAGTAEFSSLEQQVTFTLKGNGRGAISVTGEVWSQPCYENKLEFEFEIDQTFIPSVLSQLQAINESHRAT